MVRCSRRATLRCLGGPIPTTTVVLVETLFPMAIDLYRRVVRGPGFDSLAR